MELNKHELLFLRELLSECIDNIEYNKEKYEEKDFNEEIKFLNGILDKIWKEI